jgi:hypothetical protein
MLDKRLPESTIVSWRPIGKDWRATSVHNRSLWGRLQQLGRIKAIESFMERAIGIEPKSEAWEARNENPEYVLKAVP